MLGIVIGLGGVRWARRARVMRARVLSIGERAYVDAARAGGAPTSRIIFRHVLPNCLAPASPRPCIWPGLAILITVPSFCSAMACAARWIHI